MNRELKSRKPKAGLLLIASPRFKNLSGPQRGTYNDRKLKAVEDIKSSMDFLDLSYPGIVYEREDAEKAMKMFSDNEVDFIVAEFLSWSEDFAWIRIRKHQTYSACQCQSGYGDQRRGDGKNQSVLEGSSYTVRPAPFHSRTHGKYERGDVEHLH